MSETIEKQFEEGTIIRCNRCNAAGPAPRGFRAIRENSWCWRMQDMMLHPCGHMDAHWIFDSDNRAKMSG